MDSLSCRRLNKKQAAYVRRLANRAIRIHDTRYNDIVGTAAFIIFFKTTILPILVGILKGAAIAGLGGAISGPLKEKVVNPILSRLISHGKLLIANKGDQTYTETLIKGIKVDMGKLLAVLKKEGAYVGNKLSSAYQKIRGIA
jgi:hypothetical protein